MASIRQTVHGGGYETVVHTHGGDVDVLKVHRLVAVAKYGFDAVVGMDVHHSDRNTLYNSPDNLEVVGPSEHSRYHALTDGWEPPERDPPDTRRLTWLEEIRAYEMYHNGDCTQQTVADQFGVTQRTISSVVNCAGRSLLSKAGQS